MMKKLFMIALATTIALSFSVKAEADGGNTANLELRVTFANDLDEARVLEIRKILVDEIQVDCRNIFDEAKHSNDREFIRNAIGDLHNIESGPISSFQNELEDILLRRPDLEDLIRDVLDIAGDIVGEITQFVEELVHRIAELHRNDAEDIRSDSEEIFNDAVASGDPSVIMDAIDKLEDNVVLLDRTIRDLEDLCDEYRDVYPDLVDYIENHFIPECIDMRDDVNEYIDDLKGILEPLTIESDPRGPFEIAAGDKLVFKVIADDPNAVNVELHPKLDNKGNPMLPDGAEFTGEVIAITSPHREGTLEWEPRADQARLSPYLAVFQAESTDGDEVELAVEITVLPAKIEIELNEDEWILDNVELGTERLNEADISGPGGPAPRHNVTNNGNVTVGIEIYYVGYGPIDAGDTPGEDRFATQVCKFVWLDPRPLPRDKSPILLGEHLHPGASKSIFLIYQAPTSLTGDTPDMGATYGLRAFAE